MEQVDPSKAISDIAIQQSRESRNAQDTLNWFMDKDGLIPRDQAIAKLKSEYDWTKKQANRAISSVVGDIVDPVQQLLHPSKGKLVGVIEYHEFKDNGSYGYVDFHDAKGKRQRVVCAKCVREAQVDTDVSHSTTGEGRTPVDATWEDQKKLITKHYNQEHDVKQKEIKPGAFLANNTTIAGNSSYHRGNDGIGSGLDAETIEGKTLTEIIEIVKAHIEMEDASSNYASTDEIAEIIAD